MYFEEGEISCLLYLDKKIKDEYNTLLKAYDEKKFSFRDYNQYSRYYQRKEDLEHFIRLIEYCKKINKQEKK